MARSKAELGYKEALARVYALERRGIKLGLKPLTRALTLLGSPERKLKFVHIAGTNGKGSVSAMVEASLRAAGYKTGLFTSPHLHRWTERVQLNGKPLSPAAATAVIHDVCDALERPGVPQLSFFELGFAIAVEAFVRAKVDIVVLEAGLGGRLDATNIVTPELAVITNVGLDHTQYLGNTVAAIAREKAGIIKRGVPVLTAAEDARALKVIEARARAMKSKLAVLHRDFGGLAEAKTAARGERVSLWTRKSLLGDVKLGLAGEHQHRNAALAHATLVALREGGWRIPDAAIRRGLARVRWPGRLERIAKGPDLWLDVAHNVDGVRALVRALGAAPVQRKRVVIFGAMEDKAHDDMLRLLAPSASAFVFTRASLARAASPRALARVVPRREVPGEVAANAAAALKVARKLAGPKGEIVCTGSLFLVAEVRALVLGLDADPPIRM